MNPQINIFPHIGDKYVEHTLSLTEVFDVIKTGRVTIGRQQRRLDLEIEKLRTLPEKAQQVRKRCLPYVTFSGTFNGERKKANLLVHSGFIVLDVDDPTLDIPQAWVDLRRHPNVLFLFLSPRGRGGKIIIPVDPIPKTHEEHVYAFTAVLRVFEAYVTSAEIKMQRDACRACFLSHDPDAYYNPDAVPVPWEVPEIEEAVPPKQKPRAKQTEKRMGDKLRAELEQKGYSFAEGKDPIAAFLETDVAHLLMDKGLARHLYGDVWHWEASETDRSFELVDGVMKIYSATMQAESPQPDPTNPVNAHRFMAYYFYKKDLTVDSDKRALRCLLADDGYGEHPDVWEARQREMREAARKEGLVVTQHTKPIRLMRAETLRVTETLGRSQERLAAAFRSGKQLLGMRADTGTGKTEAGISYFFEGFSGVITTPTLPLAQEIENRLDTREVDVFRWRGITSNIRGEFPHESPCSQPERYQAIVDTGRDAQEVLCPECPDENRCVVEGYLSQKNRVQPAQVAVFSHKNLFFHPSYRQFLNIVIPRESELDLVVIDEYDPLHFLEFSLPEKRLSDMVDMWGSHPLGDFAANILAMCMIRKNPFLIRECLGELTEGDRKAIDTALAGVKIGAEVLDREAEHVRSRHLLSRMPTEQIRQLLPKIESADFNLLRQLQLFFDFYKHPETAPMLWQENRLVFYLPPQSYWTRSRILCMSATLDEKIFRKVFARRQKEREDVGFVQGADTEWKAGAKVYQLRTNRNPRSTLLDFKKEDERKDAAVLSRTGMRFWEAICSSIQSQPDRKHGVITYKKVLEQYREDLNNRGVLTSHFGGLVGLDAAFKGVDVLHILGAPEIPADAVETVAKFLYGDTEAALSFERDADGYIDTEVREIHEHIVRSELIQAVGRARLVLYPVTVIIWSSHELPSISHREQTLLFDENDWEAAAGDLSKLHDVIRDREKAESDVESAVAAGDITATADAKGVSERHARRLTKDARDAKKEEEQLKIFELHKQGVSQREIAKKVGISVGKVNKILKAFTNGHALNVLYSTKSVSKNEQWGENSKKQTEF